MDSPLINLGFLLLVGYVFQLWLSDLKAAKAGKSSQGSLPGALPSSINLILNTSARIIATTPNQTADVIADRGSSGPGSCLIKNEPTR